MLVIPKKPEPKQSSPSEVSRKIEAKSDIVAGTANKDETLLYSSHMEAVSFQFSRQRFLPGGSAKTLSEIPSKAKDTALRRVVVSIGDKQASGITIDCREIEKDDLARVVIDREFDEDHIEIEFDLRVKEFYRPKDGIWGYFGVGLKKDMDAPPKKEC